jgi:ribosome-associated heat shock protein Hsp15
MPEYSMAVRAPAGAHLMADTVRLDVWLDIACLFRTRSEAQRELKVGRITVNGVVAKPHRDVRVVVRGLADTHIAKTLARELYEDRTPPPTPEEIEVRRLERLFRATQKAPQRLDRRTQRGVAKRKWTT